MSGTKSFPADNVKLHISSAADAPTGTMTVLMRTNRYYTDGSLLQTGEEYTVTKEWGQDALSRNWCEDVAGVFPETETPSGLTATETAATKALVSSAGNLTDLIAPGLLSGVVYDASNRATAWTIDGVTYSANYSGGAITVAGSDGTITNISVDPAQRITAVATA